MYILLFSKDRIDILLSCTFLYLLTKMKEYLPRTNGQEYTHHQAITGSKWRRWRVFAHKS